MSHLFQLAPLDYIVLVPCWMKYFSLECITWLFSFFSSIRSGLCLFMEQIRWDVLVFQQQYRDIFLTETYLGISVPWLAGAHEAMSVTGQLGWQYSVYYFLTPPHNLVTWCIELVPQSLHFKYATALRYFVGGLAHILRVKMIASFVFRSD